MAEIFIYGTIGESWYWDEESITGKTIRDQLAVIPKGEAIDLRINSGGGDCGEALAIYNLLAQRASDITTYIDGYCCSAASFIALAGDEVVSPESSIWMIHNPSTIVWGTATEIRKTADMLDTHRDAVLGIYTDRTGKSRDEVIAALDAETWFTGLEAQDFGLATRVTKDLPAVEQVLPKNLVAMAKKGDRQKLRKAGWQISQGKERGSGRNAIAAHVDVSQTIQEKNEVELQEQLDAANKALEQAKSDAAKVQQTASEQSEKLATENAALKKEAIVGQYWQVRSKFSDALLLDNAITEEELYSHFSENADDDLKELAEMSTEDASADLRSRQRVFNKLSQRKPLERVSEGDRSKFQQSLKSKTVDGNPAVKADAVEATDKADDFLKTLPKARSY